MQNSSPPSGSDSKPQRDGAPTQGVEKVGYNAGLSRRRSRVRAPSAPLGVAPQPNPLAADAELDPELRAAREAFLARAQPEPTTGCLLWLGSIDPKTGYGRIGNGGLAHRVAYELFVGPIPDGLELDHVVARGCSTRACVNPAHLEAVTHRENILRSKAVPALHAAQTHCVRGHEFTPENTRMYRGKRVCRQCGTERMAARTLAKGGTPRGARTKPGPRLLAERFPIHRKGVGHA